MKKKAIIRGIISFVIIIALLAGLQRLVVPKYATNLLEGSFTKEYYSNAGDHQVIMVGDCELYENIDPVTIWKNYGISSYIRGNAQQLTWQSYYILKETLKYETPDVVVFSVLELKYNEPQKEEYNRLTLDNLKWSKEKIEAINASIMSDENKMEYVFPILRYHSRITQLTSEDYKYYFGNTSNTISGYYMRIDQSPYEIGQWGQENYVGKYSEINSANCTEEYDDEDDWSAEADEDDWSAESDDDDDWSAEADYEGDGDEEEMEPLGDNALYYLDLIRELCEKNGIELLLIKAPSVSPYWYPEWEEQIVEYATKYDLNYINYLELVDDLGIDFETDTYDEGLHMNYSGAIKCADYLGQYLLDNYHLEDKRNDEKVSEKWKQIELRQQEIYNLEKDELETYGEVRSF